MIILTIFMVVFYGCVEINSGNKHGEIPVLDTKHYTDAIGFSVYSFEGIGLILPLKEITA